MPIATAEGGKMMTRTVIRTAQALKSRGAFFAISTEHEYTLALKRLSALVNEIGDNLEDPRYYLIETLSVLIEAYDRRQSVRQH